MSKTITIHGPFWDVKADLLEYVESADQLTRIADIVRPRERSGKEYAVIINKVLRKTVEFTGIFTTRQSSRSIGKNQPVALLLQSANDSGPASSYSIGPIAGTGEFGIQQYTGKFNTSAIGSLPSRSSAWEFKITLTIEPTETAIKAMFWHKENPAKVYNCERIDKSDNRLKAAKAGLWASTGSTGSGRSKFKKVYFENLQFRIFTDRIPYLQDVFGGAELNQGRVKALCRATKAEITLKGVNYVWGNESLDGGRFSHANVQDYLDRGELAILLLDRSDHHDELTFTCVQGDIDLDVMQPENDALGSLSRFLPFEVNSISGLLLFASGLSLQGGFKLHWVDAELNMPANLTTIVGKKPASENQRYLLELDRSRIKQADSDAIISAFQKLSIYVNPLDSGNPDKPSSESVPVWACLEMSDKNGLPALSWEWTDVKWAQFLGKEKFDLLLTDQQAYDAAFPPRTMAKISINNPQLTSSDGALSLAISKGQQTGSTNDKLSYKWQKDKGAEWFKIGDHHLTFNPILLASTLRQIQHIPHPDSEYPEDVERMQDLLWAFLPLDDGWAQVPFFNLSEQRYLDNGLENEEVLTDVSGEQFQQNQVFQGAVCFENAALEHQKPKWSLSILDCKSMSGTIELKKDLEGDGYSLESINLEYLEPVINLTGLLWMTGAAPTIDDALPDLASPNTRLFPLSLKTYSPDRELFPNPVEFRLEGLKIGPGKKIPKFGISAELKSANDEKQIVVTLQANRKTWTKFNEKSQIPDALLSSTPSKSTALIWKRHKNLPMIQTLPLTQNREVPNHPSASRQLFPFSPSTKDSQPHGWTFAIPIDDGSAGWPNFTGELAIPDALASDKPGVEIGHTALSVPGVDLLPSPATQSTSAIVDPLRKQYRFDLPYNDELYALAALPIKEGMVDAQALLKPLTREAFDTRWNGLSKKLSLAAADAVIGFTDSVNTEVVASADGLKYLIEPYTWVSPDIDLSNYPGKIVWSEEGGDSEEQEGIDALGGLNGNFTRHPENQSRLKKSSSSGDSFEVIAGSMSGYRQNNGSPRIRDQRGLYRGQVEVSEGDDFLEQPIEIEFEEKTSWQLTTALTALNLNIDKESSWKFWFKNLPIATADSTFNRSNTSSRFAEDVNDPEGGSKEYNALNAYEWRLASSGGSGGTSRPLSMLGLDFFPLRLETLEMSGGQVRRVDIVGRLQLPLSGFEQTNYTNAVKCSWRREEQVLTLISVEAQDSARFRGEWPLFDNADGKSPVLSWSGVELINIDGAAAGFKIMGAELSFNLLNGYWTAELGELDLSDSKTLFDRTIAFKVGNEDVIEPDRVLLTLNKSGKHKASLGMMITDAGGLDQQRPSLFAARVKFNLDDVQDIVWESPEKVGKDSSGMPFIFDPDSSGVKVSAGTALEFHWNKTSSGTPIEFLPGMTIKESPKLDSSKETLDANAIFYDMPGFAAYSFSVGDQLRLSTTTRPERSLINVDKAVIETIVTCDWNDAAESEYPKPLSLLTSSSGSVVIGISANYPMRQDKPDTGTGNNGHEEMASVKNAWDYEFLLNGNIRIKNLISWPQELIEDDTIVPSYRSHATKDEGLKQVIHSIDILINQLNLSYHEMAMATSGSALFSIEDWTFKALVQHQLLPVTYLKSSPELRIDGEDARWTSLQDVRFFSPRHLPEDGHYNAARLPDERDAVFVETGAANFIKPVSVSDSGEITGTNLQLLPIGNQRGTLTSPHHYYSSLDNKREWHIVAVPFLGRMFHDPSDSETGYQFDPWYRFETETNEKDKTGYRVFLNRAVQDAPLKRAEWQRSMNAGWHRLDPAMLAENWFRIQHAGVSRDQGSYFSILANAQNTPGMLSQDQVIQKAMQAFRYYYPPDLRPTEHEAFSDFVLSEQGGFPDTAIETDNGDVFPWMVCNLGRLFARAGLNVAGGVDAPPNPRFFVSATVLRPAHRDDPKGTLLPFCFAVSPYLSFNLQRDPGKPLEADSVKLVSVELIGYDPALGDLKTVSSKMFSDDDASRMAPELAGKIRSWGTQTILRLCPGASMAFFRLRRVHSRVFRDQSKTAGVSYRFETLALPDPRAGVAQRTYQLRSEVESLRFKEGQFGGYELPDLINGKKMLSGPLVGAYKPIYEGAPPDTWPWGFSAMRYEVQQSGGGIGTAGRPLSFSSTDSNEKPGQQESLQDNDGLPEAQKPEILWWQGQQVRAQFRSALSDDGDTMGLPAIFRARSIDALVSAPTDLPLPDKNQLASVNDSIYPWQPILPGQYTLINKGNRPGVMISLRSQLQTQIFGPNSHRNLISSSVPVQHRSPRPVPLPKNKERKREHALRSWAGYFDPERTVKVTENRYDLAFFDTVYLSSYFEANRISEGVEIKPGSVGLELLEPADGVITADWNEEFKFKMTTDLPEIEKWLSPRFYDGNQWQRFVQSPAASMEPGSFSIDDVGNLLVVKITAPKANSNDLRLMIDVGNIIAQELLVNPEKEGDMEKTTKSFGFVQSLNFPIRRQVQSVDSYPIKQHHIYFEDPEYNRRLASAALQKSKLLQNEAKTPVALSADRREYNSDSDIYFRLDLKGRFVEGLELNLMRINSETGLQEELLAAIDMLDARGIGEVDTAPVEKPIEPPGKLYVNTLNRIRLSGLSAPQLVPGDVLEMEITQEGEVIVNLKFDVISDPVIPAPEAAYGLLRNNGDESVECVRYARGPMPERVDLISAEDLLTGIVRRRAVFKWQDAVRFGRKHTYAVQKITNSGSTNIPALGDSGDFVQAGG